MIDSNPRFLVESPNFSISLNTRHRGQSAMFIIQAVKLGVKTTLFVDVGRAGPDSADPEEAHGARCQGIRSSIWSCDK